MIYSSKYLWVPMLFFGRNRGYWKEIFQGYIEFRCVSAIFLCYYNKAITQY